MASITFPSFSVFATYILLTLTFLALWLPASARQWRGVSSWLWLLLTTLLLGLAADVLDWSALLPVALLAASCVGVASGYLPVWLRITSGVLLIAVSFALSSHLFPGFNNPQLIDQAVLKQDALPYSRFLNFDKALVGLFILALIVDHRLENSGQWRVMLWRVFPVIGLTLLTVLTLSCLSGYVRFDPVFSADFWVWAWTNLFFTCMAEEAVFRGVAQLYLISALAGKRYGDFCGIAIPALVFGLLHYAGGGKYIVLASVAGFGYGYAYYRTGRIEASILTHFLLNSAHFVFFTYPALASAISG